MKENKLLPCPFCGGEAQIILDKTKISLFRNWVFYQVRCSEDDCNIGTTPWNFKDGAIDSWNRRIT
jgi:Lar family restriction alleviation protein